MAAVGEVVTREELAQTREDVRAALEEPELRAMEPVLAAHGVPGAAAPAFVEAVARDPHAQREALALQARLQASGAQLEDAAAERWLLARQVLTVLDRLPALPVSAAVLRWFLADFRLFARPDKRTKPLLRLGGGCFGSMCREASLLRFPAGQLAWEISGLERRAILRVPWRQRARLLGFLATRMRGFAPAFFTHLNGHRRNRFVIVEEESNRSYHCLAESLRQQPGMIGLVTVSWFHALNVADASPHLAWTNRVILEHGGLVVAGGPAEADSGVLDNNARRRQQVLDGQLRPEVGIVLWPRDAMIAWAAANPQYAGGPVRPVAAPAPAAAVASSAPAAASPPVRRAGP